MNITGQSIRFLFGGCALGLAGLVVSGCTDGSSDGPNLLPMEESAAAATTAGKPSSVGGRRHGEHAKPAPQQHIKTSEDADLSAKELRAKKLKAKGQGAGA